MAKPPQTAYFDWQGEVMPPWLAGPVGQRYIGTCCSLTNHIGLEGDTLALRAAQLTNPDQPPDAISRLGAERQLDRGPTETDAQYKARLNDAWTAWEYAGAAYSITSQLALIGLTAEVKQNTDWDWDGNTAAWARFWVVVTSHPWTTSWQWGDGSVWGGGQTWGSTASIQEVQTVQSIVAQWKPAHCFCDKIIIVVNSSQWAIEQPDGTWDDPANRSTAALYWRGTPTS
ncbi:MAG: hypothetical protein ACWGPR_08500 [Candidatus Deferrimicrobiaceae bacterium]